MFYNWFNKHFRGTNSSSAIILPDTNYKIHFYKHFKKEFAENFSIFLDFFLQQRDKETAPYVAYENLIRETLYDTYTQIDLAYNPKHEESEEKTKEKD